MSGRPNAHMIFLPTPLFMGLIKKMAAQEIGQSAAILDCVNETLHSEGHITDADYDKFKKAYSRKLRDVVEERESKSRPLTEGQRNEEKSIADLQKQFSNILKQGFDTLSEKSKEYWVKKAEEYRDKVPNAKFVLACANGELLNE